MASLKSARNDKSDLKSSPYKKGQWVFGVA